MLLGVGASDLVFTRKGSHLMVSILDSDDSIAISNWYNGEQYQLDCIQTNDGYSLAREQVDLLIQAMASFESESGMNWQEAARLQEEQVASITQQYWMKQVG